MRMLQKALAATSLLALVGGMLVAPATAARQLRPPTRSVTRAFGHATDDGAAQDRATSFEVFSRSDRDKVLGSGVPDRDPTTSPSAPVVATVFDAIADAGVAIPSDTIGAIGPSSIVTAVNSQVAVFDAVTHASELAATNLEGLNPDTLGVDNFDPKVVYDPYAGVHVLVWLGVDNTPRESFIFIAAIPDSTASNMGSWCITSYLGDQVNSDPDRWADYPGVGFNDTRLTITTNQFTFPLATGQFRYAQVLSFAKTGLYDCNQKPSFPVVFAGNQTRDPLGNQSFTLQPAQTFGGSPGGQLLLSFQLVPGKFDYLVIWRITAGLQLKKARLLTGKVGLPPPGTQGGGSVVDPDLWWDAGDERLINAFYDADRNELFAAHAVFKNFKPDPITGGYAEAAVRWYEVDPGSKLKNSVLSRKGLIGGPEFDVGWPTVASGASGVLYVTYSRASDPRNEFLSAWVAEILAASTTDTQALIRSGNATYDAKPGIERWGDFNGMSRDPVSSNNALAVNQYALDADSWQQVVGYIT